MAMAGVNNQAVHFFLDCYSRLIPRVHIFVQKAEYIMQLHGLFPRRELRPLKLSNIVKIFIMRGSAMWQLLRYELLNQLEDVKCFKFRCQLEEVNFSGNQQEFINLQ